MLKEIEKLRMLARMFTRPVLTTLGRTGDWRVSMPFLEDNHLVAPGPEAPLAQIFQQAWLALRRSYRNEYVYKNEIANRVIFGRHSPSVASLHIEMPVGKSIVDAAVYNGTSTAYEIKTEFDSAKRLRTQTADYVKAFDHVYIVAHPAFASDYANLVPQNIGIYSLRKAGSLSIVRRANSNLFALDHNRMFRCMHRSEYTLPLFRHLQIDPKFPNTLIARRCEELFSTMSIEDAHSFYVDALRRRKCHLQLSNFVSSLPSSLRALAYATPLSGIQQKNLTTSLNEMVPINLV